MTWVSIKYDTVILKITIHTTYTKRRVTKHPKHLLEEHVTNTAENIQETQSTPAKRGCIFACTFICSRHSIRTIIAKVKYTQNTIELEG